MHHLPCVSGDPLAALRQATGAQHDTLDQGLPLSRPDATLADYLDHLRMLAQWLAPIQAWQRDYRDGPQGPAAPPALDRLATIAADLDGAPTATPDASAAGRWPDHASAAYRWGVAYVVEGSQLGGAVLYKRLAAQLAPHPLRYLQSGQDGPGPRWRAFISALKAEVRSDAEIAQACAGAQAAFARILALAP
jgi:heme oxygenase